MLTVRPSELLCVVCAAGGCPSPLAGSERVQTIVSQTRADSFLTVRLEADVAITRVHYLDAYGDRGSECVPADFGARQANFATRLRDLSILRLLGLQPGDERSAYDIAQLIFRNIESLDGICRFEDPSSADWEECPHARLGYYESVRDGQVPLGVGAVGIANSGMPVQAFVSPRSEEEMQAAKRRSVATIERAEHLYLRPQHLMCIACYYGTEIDEPLAVDNLYEIRLKMEREPDIPVTVTEGNCMVCDPCPLLDTEINVCLGTHVRDPLRDLMILRKLGLRPGDTLPARELYRMLFDRIRTAAEICAWGDGRTVTNEWRICTDVETGRYENAIRRNMLGTAADSH